MHLKADRNQLNLTRTFDIMIKADMNNKTKTKQNDEQISLKIALKLHEISAGEWRRGREKSVYGGYGFLYRTNSERKYLISF